MSSVGSYLRELRERRGVSLEEIARTTRVGRPYLEALENGEFGKLPAPVFTRGFVLAYCQALGVSADEALTRYSARARAAHETEAVPPTVRDRAATRGRGPVLVSFVLLIVLGFALFAVALVLQSGREGDERRTDVRGPRKEPARPAARPEPAPAIAPTPGAGETAATSATAAAPPGAAPAVSQVPAGASAVVTTPAAGPTSPATPTAPPAPATLTQQEATSAVGSVSAPYRLVARTSAATWIRVRTEDGRQSDETVAPGQVREWVSNRPFTISVGNAGGVTFELNGRRVPSLGPAGAVVTRLVLPTDNP